MRRRKASKVFKQVQGNMMVAQYGAKFNELAKYDPWLARRLIEHKNLRKGYDIHPR